MIDVVWKRADDLVGGRSSAVFSPDEKYRYVLTRAWNTRLDALVWVMLNPSTADALIDDPTITRCRQRADTAGYGGIVVVNLFALRATNPAMLWKTPNPAGEHNAVFLNADGPTFHKDQPVGDVVFAWGAHALAEPRGRALDVALRAAGYTPLCLGWTKAGHPRHPLYVPGAQPLVPFPGYQGGGAQ
jgi:hypothetical protein